MPLSEPQMARQRLAAVIHNSPGDAEKIATARRDLAAAKIENYVARVIAEAPPLTADQCATIARMLVPFAGGGAR